MSVANEPRWTRENRVHANHALLDHLRAFWDLYPDMRFGQLVMNLSREEGGFADTWEWKHGQWFQAINTTLDQYREPESNG